MLNDQEEKVHIKEMVMGALKEFSEVQANLASTSAREAMAIRITTDIVSKYTLIPNERIEGGF